MRFSGVGTVNIIVVSVSFTACYLAIVDPGFREFFEKIVEWVVVGYFAQKIPHDKRSIK